MNIDEIISSLQYIGQNIDADRRKELTAIINAKDRVSPRYITELDLDEIFVFGSNIKGKHKGRASKIARENFHAEMGVGNGRTGEAYAIPTIDENGNKYETEQVKPFVDEFITYVGNHKELTFFVTRIGCGYAGFKDEEIAPLFKEALKLENVYLPQSFLDELFHIECDCETPSGLVPFKGAEVKNFANDMEQQFSKYLNWLRKNQDLIHRNKKERLEVMDCVEHICGCIIKAIDLSLRGLPSSAYIALKEEMDKIVKSNDSHLNINLLSEVSKDVLFYRMRVEKDNWAKKEIDKYGMFHIPFSKRYMVKTQRYSVPGYPCLYLAEHIFGCWEELGRPNINDCLISAFKSQKNFDVLDLRIPSAEKWVKGDKDIIKTIILFPLVIACTFKSENPTAAYKPEYIVPQLLLQYVKELAFEKNKAVKTKDARVVYGIRYTSVNIPNDSDSQTKVFDFKSNVYDNYVIPVIDIKNDYCSKLSSLFKLTEPICEEFERLDNLKESSSNDITQEERYSDSVFGKLEKVLRNRELLTI